MCNSTRNRIQAPKDSKVPNNGTSLSKPKMKLNLEVIKSSSEHQNRSCPPKIPSFKSEHGNKTDKDNHFLPHLHQISYYMNECRNKTYSQKNKMNNHSQHVSKNKYRLKQDQTKVINKKEKIISKPQIINAKICKSDFQMQNAVNKQTKNTIDCCSNAKFNTKSETKPINSYRNLLEKNKQMQSQNYCSKCKMKLKITTEEEKIADSRKSNILSKNKTMDLFDNECKPKLKPFSFGMGKFISKPSTIPPVISPSVRFKKNSSPSRTLTFTKNNNISKPEFNHSPKYNIILQNSPQSYVYKSCQKYIQNLNQPLVKPHVKVFPERNDPHLSYKNHLMQPQNSPQSYVYKSCQKYIQNLNQPLVKQHVKVFPERNDPHLSYKNHLMQPVIKIKSNKNYDNINSSDKTDNEKYQKDIKNYSNFTHHTKTKATLKPINQTNYLKQNLIFSTFIKSKSFGNMEETHRTQKILKPEERLLKPSKTLSECLKTSNKKNESSVRSPSSRLIIPINKKSYTVCPTVSFLEKSNLKSKKSATDISFKKSHYNENTIATCPKPINKLTQQYRNSSSHLNNKFVKESEISKENKLKHKPLIKSQTMITNVDSNSPALKKTPQSYTNNKNCMDNSKKNIKYFDNYCLDSSSLNGKMLCNLGAKRDLPALNYLPKINVSLNISDVDLSEIPFWKSESELIRSPIESKSQLIISDNSDYFDKCKSIKYLKNNSVINIAI